MIESYERLSDCVGLFKCRDALRNTPPAPLHERYLQCTVPWYEAIFEAQGIASGNAALAVPLIMGCLLPLLFIYMKVSHCKDIQSLVICSNILRVVLFSKQEITHRSQSTQMKR